MVVQCGCSIPWRLSDPGDSLGRLASVGGGNVIRRSLFLSVAGAALLALPASATAASAPPPGALVAQDAAGTSVAVWTAADGTLQTARQVVGQSWSRAVTLY